MQDMGTIVLGKIESGTVFKGQVLALMPNKVGCISSIWSSGFFLPMWLCLTDLSRPQNIYSYFSLSCKFSYTKLASMFIALFRNDVIYCFAWKDTLIYKAFHVAGTPVWNSLLFNLPSACQASPFCTSLYCFAAPFVDGSRFTPQIRSFQFECTIFQIHMLLFFEVIWQLDPTVVAGNGCVRSVKFIYELWKSVCSVACFVCNRLYIVYKVKSSAWFLDEVVGNTALAHGYPWRRTRHMWRPPSIWEICTCAVPVI